MIRKTWSERSVSRLLQYGKRHKSMKLPVLAAVTAVLCIAGIGRYFGSNGKKYASIAAVFLFCAMSSSFSFPGLTEISAPAEETAVFSPVQEEQLDEFLYEVEEEPVQLLDDSDVLDGYDNSELENVENLDKYTLDEILEENQGVPETASPDAGEAAAAESGTFDPDDWRLLLINKQHPIPEDYTFELGTIKGSMRCDARILDDLLAMLQGAKEDGIHLAICSPYRDLDRQEVLFNRKIKAYMGKGMSYMDAYKLASQAVTVPGASEHQVGLALDIISDEYSALDEGFGDTAAGKWLAEHSCEYGFILRYPAGKEYITSIEYEPWHFRYVGKEAATAITRQGLTLEEFVEGL